MTTTDKQLLLTAEQVIKDLLARTKPIASPEASVAINNAALFLSAVRRELTKTNP